ncbi:WAPL (Wings apart-like protein regulation of heterochromatin) protein [Thalictrum thalictroides]|uniref:WAPL (Wings apart-like protein regulation of heterochromatin) protein n=1 Tax=Thalictrum thalictroides TaxID=46969 RepID=A0A7J6V8M4_THATH|nr:WAPL (Wings apart-like protein regulation of heterochromatin) protein [Thalictrum thalictroides]
MPVLATSTLMEAQEFGEMMEHVDEVNFALDGLRKRQPARIRRASLLSLLSICETVAQRRLLRTQGMAKTILDAILSLSLDDSPSTLAAAALFYVLASDGEDEQLLDSPICIRFLLSLLSPSIPVTSEEKRPTVGSKLLALCREPEIVGDQSKRLDASATAILSKVQEILLSCKEIQSNSRDDEEKERPELTPKWIALLTIEKACLSTVSIEDTSATVRKVGGSFKETLREHGGLDAVFDVAADCHLIMERWLDHRFPSSWMLKDDVALQTVILLLKCLKIMENATFLSKDNQDHLLGMNGKSGCDGSSLSFTGLVISIIKILSGLSLHHSSPISSKETSNCLSNGIICDSESPLEADHGDRIGSFSRSSSSMKNVSHVESMKASQKRQNLSTTHTVYTVSSSETLSFSSDVNASHVESFKVSQKRQKLSTSHTVYTVSSSKTSSLCADDSVMKDDKPSTSSSCNGILKSINGRSSRNRSRKVSLGVGGRSPVTENIKFISLEDSQDPFAFQEDEFEPSKWDILSTKKDASQSQKRRGAVTEVQDECNLMLMSSQNEPNNGKDSCSSQKPCSPSDEEENSNILDDCLLAAVKVLMNLTNDNPLGCEQIAACGGLETLSALISGHYPSFISSLSPFSKKDESIREPKCSNGLQYEKEKHFTDQELDFLVAILGLLVNLVEKDSHNRSRLAATTVPMCTSGGLERKDSSRNVIPLLCSIFLSNQGASEMPGEGKMLPWDDEAALLQGEREAEKMIIEAYAALLLAFLQTESKSVREAIACCLPNHNLEVLVPVLERFVAFHLSLKMISPETHKAVTEVIESCKGS